MKERYGSDFKVSKYDLMSGDCIKRMQYIPAKMISSTITSPPFKLEELKSDGVEVTSYGDWFISFLAEIERVTVDYALIFNSSRNLIELIKKTADWGSVKQPKLFRILNWFKPRIQMPFRYEPILIYQMPTARYNINRFIWCDVLPYSPVMRSPHVNYQNPMPLYLHLMAYLHPTYTDIILDPCMGFGTTGVAANWFHRRFVGIDYSNECFETTQGRLEAGFEIEEILPKNRKAREKMLQTIGWILRRREKWVTMI